MNIVRTIQELHDNVHVTHEIICVYDCDEDNTIPVIQELRTTYDNLRSVKNIIAAGPSGAIRTGILQSSAPYVLVVMADLCDDFSQISTMLSLVCKGPADIVSPSRYCKGGEQRLDNAAKAWLPRAAGLLLKFFCNIGTLDPTNSYKLYSKRVLDDLRLSSTVSFSVTLEIVAKAHCLGYRIVEVPTVWKDRVFGQSGFNTLRSVPAYLQWFILSLLNNRLIVLPDKWFRYLFSLK
jgi:glycosyltransferase involved in cell wall biosynthesis